MPFVENQDFLSVDGLNRMAAALGLESGSALMAALNFRPNDMGTGLFSPAPGQVGIALQKKLRMLFTAAGLSLLAADGISGLLAHANTLDRTYQLPNKSGTIALLDDVGEGGGGGSVVELENKTGSTCYPGQVVAMHSSGAGFQMASAADNLRNGIGILLEETSHAATGRVQVEGIVDLEDWTEATGSPSLTGGQRWFLSPTTAGELTGSSPTGSGKLVQLIGVAITSSKLDIRLEPKFLKA